MSRHLTPTKPGWYWAKWKIATEATHDGDELTPSERFEWGPAFAAGCVLRYLRRGKAREHNLESARWYYARLVEGCAKAPRSDVLGWQSALDRLELILTKEERVLARGGESNAQ